MQVSTTFSNTKALQGQKHEFVVNISPEEMEGREVESFICFSQHPESLEVCKGDNWVPCSGIMGCSLLVEESIRFRAQFDTTGKIKMNWYCTSEGSLLKEVVQYVDVVDSSLPDISCTLPESFRVHDVVEFTVRFATPHPSSQPRKVQYVFSSMDSVKRIERLIEDETSSWNGKWILLDRSQFNSGEMFTFGTEDHATFKTSFLAYGDFKLHILVDGVLQATFPFKVLSRNGEENGIPPQDPRPTLEKAPEGCTMEVCGESIWITYPDVPTQNFWRSQIRDFHGPSNGNEIYSTIRFKPPVESGWCRLVVESITGIWTTELKPIPKEAGGDCIWSFPIARKVNGRWTELDWCKSGTWYKVSVTFCNYLKGKWIQTSSKTWTLKCRHRFDASPNPTIWSSELLHYLRMILNGCTTASAVKAYGTWHKWPSGKIFEELMKCGQDFGRFALDNGLVSNAEEMSAVNWQIAKGNQDAQMRLGLYGFDPCRREARSLENALIRSGWRPKGGFGSCPCRRQ